MSSDDADEIAHSRELAPLTASDVARATGASESGVEAWLARTRTPKGSAAERVVELSAIVEHAVRVLHAEASPVWLNTPLPSLDVATPIDLIARGEYRRVSDTLAGLETATFS